MKIRLLLFAHIKDIVGAPELQLEFEGACTGNDIVDRLERRHPAIASQRQHLKISIDGEYAKLSDAIPHGSEVALLPPVSGG